MTAVRNARRSRIAARAPRAALVAVASVLALAGVRTIVTGPPETQGTPHAPAPSADLAAQGVAERFARAYLEYDPSRPELREQALAGLGVDDASGLSPPPSRRPAAVRWAAAVADRRRGSTHHVTVAAQTTGGLVHLSVPVRRAERGLLAIAGPPALVGEPPRSRARDDPGRQRPVDDGALRAVAERVVRNYLAGERRNLAADLSPVAVVSLPAQAYLVADVEQVTWVQSPRLVAVDVQASQRQGGGRALLRYELGVARRGGRWQVTSIGDGPTDPDEGEQR